MPCASGMVGSQPDSLPTARAVACFVNHALNYPKGALPSIQHDHIRDITAQLLTEVCLNVAIEPTL